MAQPIALVVPAVFWRNVDCSAGLIECWPWTGSADRDGYGEYSRRVDGKRFMWRAHRVAYELTIGPIPEGLVIDHLCRVRLCCNPAHMEPVTNAENIRRGEGGRSRQEACPNGHAYTAGSFRIRRDKWRSCLICEKARKERFASRT